MTDAFKEIVTNYSETHSQTKVLVNYASSGALGKQIYQGAPADIYISANPKWVDYLEENDAIERVVTNFLPTTDWFSLVVLNSC